MVYALEEQHCTSILLSESQISEKIPPEWYVTSGLILLHHIRKGDTMERSIQTVKLRGIKHSEQIFPIKLNEFGLQILHPRISP